MLRLWLCEACGLGYTDPQPRGAVERRYLDQHDLASHFGALEPRKRALNIRRIERLPPPAGGRRLLDVGCGDGLFAEMAAQSGWRPHGIELNPPAVRAARRRGVDVVQGRVEDVEVGTAAFDLVTAWDVIEHVAEPVPFIQQLARAVTPGGTLIVTTLNRRALVARAFRGRWSMVADEHFTYWDARSLRQAFESQGLRIVRTTHFGLGRDFVAWVDRWRGGPEHPAASRRAPQPSLPAAAATTQTWDSRRGALAAESALNRLLDVTALGVGLQLVLSSPAR